MKMDDGVFEANGVVLGAKDTHAMVVPFKVDISNLVLKVHLYETHPTLERGVYSVLILHYGVQEPEIVNKTSENYLFVKEHSFHDTVDRLVGNGPMRDANALKDVFEILFSRAGLAPRHSKLA